MKVIKALLLTGCARFPNILMKNRGADDRPATVDLLNQPVLRGLRILQKHIAHYALNKYF